MLRDLQEKRYPSALMHGNLGLGLKLLEISSRSTDDAYAVRVFVRVLRKLPKYMELLPAGAFEPDKFSTATSTSCRDPAA